MTLDLWDVATGNLIGVFGSEAEALKVAGALPTGNGPHYANALSLGAVDERGEGIAPVSTGRALIDRLHALLASSEPARLPDVS